MKVREILECCLYADNLDETADWYADCLGLEPFSQTPDRSVFFRIGNRCFFLFKPSASLDPTTTTIGVPTHGASGPGHVCFAILASELAPWRNRLAQLGIPIEREIEWPNGARSLYMRDPAHNSVELASPSLWGISERECFPWQETP
ncbi:MAG: VOC family protein [Phycisphaerales bacterium]|nr:VOC family protein [Phycisphaerales bacterium]MCB9863890.1 VOC family protein [Phycisphaerales bacterium]